MDEASSDFWYSQFEVLASMQELAETTQDHYVVEAVAEYGQKLLEFFHHEAGGLAILGASEAPQIESSIPTPESILSQLDHQTSSDSQTESWVFRPLATAQIEKLREAEPETFTSAELSPNNFVALLEHTIQADDEEDSLVLVRRFATLSTVEFFEPLTAEEDMTHLSQRVDIEISKFIEDCSKLTTIKLLGEVDTAQLREIYNPHNLLAFAKDVMRRTDGHLAQADLDLIYRYRTVLSMLAQCSDQLGEKHEAGEPNIRHDGWKTWGGYIHPYGHALGIIDPTEYRDFDADKEENMAVIAVVEGVKTNLRRSEKVG